MLRRLFGQKKSLPVPATTLPTELVWSAPQARAETYFNLHLYGLPLAQATAALTAHYGYAATDGPAILIQPQRAWVTAYFVPALVAKVGFNKHASDIAREHNTWLIGYRIYAGQGMDVHYFDRAAHVAGLALGEDELEREPLSAALFAELADVSQIVPRPATQHPLDFHWALLNAIGIRQADLTWDEAWQRYANGEFSGAQIIGMPS